MYPKLVISNEKINLEDYIYSFSWKQRVILFITKEKYIHFINEMDNFFKTNKCENKVRNLKYIRIVGDEVQNYVFPDKYRFKYGVWLIGYDGQEKAYSSDISLIKKIYNIIDKMPIREKEIEKNSKQIKKCD